TLPLPPAAIPLVTGRIGIVPTATPDPGLFAGAAGSALLLAALALSCGAGGLLAFRALRRESAAQHREAEALRARGDFLTTVTHELKTPLAGVRLVAELLADGRIT